LDLLDYFIEVNNALMILHSSVEYSYNDNTKQKEPSNL
jgi:hypothetical protein